MAEYDARMCYPDLDDVGFRLDWTRYYNPTTSDAIMYLETARGTAAPVVGVTISSVDVLSPTSIRLNFNVPVLDNQALNALENYVITPALKVLSVTPEAVVSPTYVILEIAEQKEGQSYQIEIQQVEAA